MHTLKHALLLRPGEWTESEAIRVRKIIDQAVEAISNGRSAEQDTGQAAQGSAQRADKGPDQGSNPGPEERKP
jgi:hypothetical protein